VEGEELILIGGGSAIGVTVVQSNTDRGNRMVENTMKGLKDRVERKSAEVTSKHKQSARWGSLGSEKGDKWCLLAV